MNMACIDGNKLRGFVKLKKIQKSEKNSGSGWVGPTRILFFTGNVVLCAVFVVLHVSKKNSKMNMGVGGCGLANLSFSRIFWFFFNLTRRLCMSTLRAPSYSIWLLSHLKLCLATATHNFKRLTSFVICKIYVPYIYQCFKICRIFYL